MKLNEIYDKGYNDGFADGTSQSDTLLAESIANYMIVKGTEASSTGNRSFFFNSLCNHFGISKDYLDGLKDDIEWNLRNSTQIDSDEGVEITDKEFNLMFFKHYCCLPEAHE